MLLVSFAEFFSASYEEIRVRLRWFANHVPCLEDLIFRFSHMLMIKKIHFINRRFIFSAVQSLLGSCGYSCVNCGKVLTGSKTPVVGILRDSQLSSWSFQLSNSRFALVHWFILMSSLYVIHNCVLSLKQFSWMFRELSVQGVFDTWCLSNSKTLGCVSFRARNQPKYTRKISWLYQTVILLNKFGYGQLFT